MSHKVFTDPVLPDNYPNAIPWTVRVVNDGDHYGLNMALIHEGEPMVEFYDGRYPHAHDTDGNVLGQFVSRYYLSTLTARDPSYGLNLEGQVDEWSASSQMMHNVMEWVTA